MKKLLFIFFSMLTLTSVGLSQATAPSSVTVRVEEAVNPSACGDVTDCAAGIICFDVYFEIDEPGWNLQSYQIWMDYGPDSTVLTYRSDVSCNHVDGGDIRDLNQFGKYRFLAANFPLGLTANQEVKIHNFCVDIEDFAGVPGLDVIGGGNHFSLVSSVNLVDQSNTSNAINPLVPASPLTLSETTLSCFIIAVDDATTTLEDTPVVIDVPANDLGPIDTLTVAEVDPPLNGTTMVNPDGTITYTPNPNYAGVDSFTYVICDSGFPGLCDTATVVITIEDGNDPPVLPDEITTTPEDTPIEICVDPTDADASDVLSIVAFDNLCGPTNGTINDPNSNDFCLIYTPDPNFHGVDSFCVVVCDDGTPVLCDTNVVIITVDPVNDAPVAIDDATTTPEDTDVTIPAPGILDNDSDVDGDMLDLNTTPITDPKNGTVTVNTDGSITYSPDPNFNGVDSFTYEICDITTVNPQPLCDTATVVITVDPVNDPPVVPDEMTTTPEDTPVEVCVDPTDVDAGDVVSGAGLDASCGPSNGSLTPGMSDLCYIYTPDPDFNGMDTFCVIVCDDGNPILCDTSVVVVTVDPVNDAPIAIDDATMTDEDVPVTIPAPGILDNDSDPDGDALDLNTTPVMDPLNGTVVVNMDGSITYTPDPGFNGVDSFTYEICDITTVNPQPLCDEATVVIDVATVNDPPVVPDEMTTTDEDTPVEVCVDPTDPDAGDVVTGAGLDMSCGPNNGTLTPGMSDLCYIYTPDPDFNGMDTFCVIVCDNGTPVLCDTAVIIVTVDPVNDAPIAIDDATMTDEDTPVTIDAPGILDNDSDPDGDDLNLNTSPITDPMNGSVVVNGDGSITYTPDPGFNGVDSFTYEVCDVTTVNPQPLCDQATVVIDVNPMNDPPVVPDEMTTTPEDTPVEVCVDPTDSDVGDIVSGAGLDVSCGPSNGTLSPGMSDLCYIYAPDPDFHGMDTFCVIVCDDGTPMLCDTSVVVITVDPVNDAPIAVDDVTSTDEDMPVTVPTPGILDNDSDPDGDPLMANTTPVTDPINGDVVINPNGSATYTPDPDFNGVDSFSYEVCDVTSVNPQPLCDTATVVITVNPQNDPPVVPDEMTTTPEDTPVDVCVDPTDVDGDMTMITNLDLSCGPNNGTVTGPDPSGLCMTYIPADDFFGSDTFCVIVCDDGIPVLCDTNQVIVTVTPVNDKPIAIDDATTTTEDIPVTISAPGILDNDSDPDGDPLNLNTTPITDPDNGMVVINPDGSLTYTPDMNFGGIDSFTYQICDVTAVNPQPLCDTATVVITVFTDNDPPVVPDEMTTTPEEVPVEICLEPTDPDGDPVTVQSIDPSCGPNNGTVTPVPGEPLCFTYTPDVNFPSGGASAFDTICFIVCDNGAPMLCDTNMTIIEVTQVNDGPIAYPDTFYTDEDTPVTFDVGDEIIDNDVDPDGMLVESTLSLTQDVMNGSLLLNGLTGEMTYTPDPNFNGVDSFIYEICDDGNPSLCADTTVYIFIEPINDPPVANQDFTTTDEDTPVFINILLNDNDDADNAEVDPSSVEIIVDPAHGTILGIDPVTGVVTYQPNPEFHGTDIFHYVVCDTGVGAPVPLCDTTQVFITVVNVNDPPIANDDLSMTDEDTPVVVDVLNNDNDPDGNLDPSTVTVIDPPNNGTIPNIDPITGEVTYEPDPNFNGVDTFTYAICDDGVPSPVLCDTAQVIITVDPVNDPPMVPDEMTTTDEDTPVDVCVDPTDIDAGDVLTIVGIDPGCGPSNGSITDPNTGDFCMTYTPDENFNGMDTFCVIVCDDGNPVLCDTATIIVTVNPVNDPPIAVDDISPADENLPVVINVDGNDSDVDGMIVPTTVDTVTSPMNGTVTLNPDGTITYEPDTDFIGVDSFDYVICDDGNPNPVLCDTATVIINVFERCTEIDLRVYLEGSYLTAGVMRTDLNDNLLLPGQDIRNHPDDPIPFIIGEATPLGQPYNRLPWNYAGSEGDAYGDPVLYPGATDYDADVVDWVLLSLRENDSLATSVIWRCAALVTELGTVEIPSDCECLNTLPQNKYYMLIEHRNHLPVMSEVIVEENELSLSDPVLAFDFTIQNSWIYKIGTFEFGVGQKEVEPGFYAMFGANGDQENGNFDRRDVNSGDNTVWFTETGKTYTYVDGDFDMNADVNSGDDTMWFINAGTTNTQIPLNIAD